MSKYFESYQELVKSDILKESVVNKHVDQQILIDNILPDTASFFLICEISSGRYPFIGSQQETISGFPNNLFQEKGVSLFIERLHPDQRDILMFKTMSDFASCVEYASGKDKKNLQFQCNYKFRQKNGMYINLLEQQYVLEVDQKGRGALTLNNITRLETKEDLPLRWSARIIRNNSISETVFINRHFTDESRLKEITPRELDVLRNLATGKSSKKIGEALFISPHTVDTHRRNILRKLDCKTVVDLVRFAFENALL